MKKRILIIDDEEDLCNLLKVSFEFRKFKTFIAHDGEEGLRLVHKKKPDAIVLDVMMPKINGYDLVNRLKEKEEHREIPILILTCVTSDSNRSDEEWRDSIGVNDFISKPCDPIEIVDRVEKMLSKTSPRH